jgi:hypothetical protein
MLQKYNEREGRDALAAAPEQQADRTASENNSVPSDAERVASEADSVASEPDRVACTPFHRRRRRLPTQHRAAVCGARRRACGRDFRGFGS